MKHKETFLQFHARKEKEREEKRLGNNERGICSNFRCPPGPPDIERKKKTKKTYKQRR